MYQIRKLNYRHEAIINMMIANPEMKQGEIAERLGITETWLSIVKGSDAFKMAYRQRLSERREDLDREVTERLYSVGIKGLKRVEEALDDPEIDPRFALDAKDKALAKLGYGKEARAGSVANLPNPETSKQDLEEARKLLYAGAEYNRSVREVRDAKLINGGIADGESEEGSDMLGQEVEDQPLGSSAEESENDPAAEVFPAEGGR